ncbi:hypothetical protein [Halomarina oriensis]|uniref:Small CPxCG-related zinc finger protein n=1 Tax=Halomarina oriensis TaxID=671145 RepID=A0A6B0GP79_9EURY|nr:hypothetical protein [Halomarina oriensis]MWG36510.1 hypothetical protein [Halomarina oriensis]
MSSNERQSTKRYHAEIECEVCHASVPFVVEELSESTEADCPECGTHYYELYI